MAEKNTILTRRTVLSGLTAAAVVAPVMLPGPALAQIDIGGLIGGITSLLKGLTFNEKDEIRLGDQLFPQLIHASGGLYRKQRVQGAIVDIMKPLMGASERKAFTWQIAILNNDAVNAWCLPGGKLGVNKGLIRYTQSEDELACVLAHEIGHAELSHAAKQMKTKQFASGLSRTGRSAFASNSGRTKTGRIANAAVTALAGPLFDMALRGYSRGNEYEADGHISKVMGSIGGNPWKAVQFLRMLMTLVPPKSKRTTSLFSTHPGTLKRIEKLAASLPAESEVSGRPSGEAFRYLKRSFPTRDVYRRQG